jgi:outer membrane cobalamin receptor
MDITELVDQKVILPTRHIITQEDIRRSGLTRIPEILCTVPGLHVGRGIFLSASYAFN